MDYKFVLTPKEVDGTTYSSSAATTDPAYMPTLVAAPTLSFAGGETWKAPSAATTNGLPTDTTYYFYDIELDLLTGINATTFPHAGVYTYEINEDTAAVPTLPSGMTVDMSQAKYQMNVYVENLSIPAKTTKVVGVGFVELENDKGTGGSNAKAFPAFVNHLNVVSDLTIKNTVTGAYGDLLKEFTFSLDMTYASGVTTGSYTGLINGTTPFSITPGTAETFKLKHEDTLVITGLPAGTTYTLTESAETKYTASTVVSINGATAFVGGNTAANTAVNTALTIGSASAPSGASTLLQSPIIIGENFNDAVFANDMADPPTPTGILLDNLPFILLILVGIGGIVGYVVLKRRRAQ